MGRTKGSGQGSVYKRGDKYRGQITVNGERRSFTSKKKKVDAYTDSEQRKLICYLKDKYEPHNVLFYLLLATGMREGEAAALTWKDIDFSSGKLNITKTAVRIKGSVTVQDHPKTASSVRTIYLSDNARRHLWEYRRVQEDHNDLVFTNTRGNIFNATVLRSRFMGICTDLNIPYKGVHALRHTFATRALEKGIDVKTVSSILGHKNVRLTMDVYQDVFSKQKKKAARIMNDLF